MLSTSVLKVVALLMVSTTLLFSGWKMREHYDDSQKLAVMEAAAAFTKVYERNEQVQATILQDKLDSLKANERIITREIPKIIMRDVYRNTCIDIPGVQLIEQARSGQAPSPSSTSEPVEPLP